MNLNTVAVAVIAALFITLAPYQASSSPEYPGEYPKCFEETPLPDYNLTPPNENVGDAARFIGMWGGGKWSNVLCNTIVVTKITKDGDSIKADVLYSYGRGFGFSPYYVSVTGNIENGKLSFTTMYGQAKVEYTITPYDTLWGTYDQFRVAMDPIRSTVVLWKK